MYISPNQVGVYFMLYQIEPCRGLAAHKKSLTCSFFVRYFIVTRFGTSQVGFSLRCCRCRSDVTVENVSETSLAEIDRRQHCDVASQHLIDNSWVCVCSRVYPCLCVSVSEWHTWRANFLPKQKKNTYRRKIHWHVEVDRVSPSMCVCAYILWLFLVNFSIWRLLFACYKYRKIPLRILAQRREAAAGNLWWFSTHALALSCT